MFSTVSIFIADAKSQLNESLGELELRKRMNNTAVMVELEMLTPFCWIIAIMAVHCSKRSMSYMIRLPDFE
jgi:hypothetical protein